jgi:hypothetical protein
LPPLAAVKLSIRILSHIQVNCNRFFAGKINFGGNPRRIRPNLSDIQARFARSADASLVGLCPTPCQGFALDGPRGQWPPWIPTLRLLALRAAFSKLISVNRRSIVLTIFGDYDKI